MRRILLAAVLLMLGTTPAQAGPPRWLLNATCGAAGSLALAEMVATERCLQRGTCVEANPIMPKGTSSGDALGRAAIKSAGTYAGVRLGLGLRERHPWWALGTCGALGTFNGWLTARGLHQR